MTAPKDELNSAEIRFLTVDELAEYLNVKHSTIRNLVFRKELRPIRVGRLLRFDMNEIERWIEKRQFD